MVYKSSNIFSEMHVVFLWFFSFLCNYWYTHTLMKVQAWTYSLSGLTSSPTRIQDSTFASCSYLRRVPNKIFPWIQMKKTIISLLQQLSNIIFFFFMEKRWIKNVLPLLSYMKLRLLRARWISSLVHFRYLCLSSGTDYNRPTTGKHTTKETVTICTIWSRIKC